MGLGDFFGGAHEDFVYGPNFRERGKANAEALARKIIQEEVAAEEARKTAEFTGIQRSDALRGMARKEALEMDPTAGNTPMDLPAAGPVPAGSITPGGYQDFVKRRKAAEDAAKVKLEGDEAVARNRIPVTSLGSAAGPLGITGDTVDARGLPQAGGFYDQGQQTRRTMIGEAGANSRANQVDARERERMANERPKGGKWVNTVNPITGQPEQRYVLPTEGMTLPKPLSDGARKAKADLGEALNQLRTVKSLLTKPENQEDIGPVAGRVAGAKEHIPTWLGGGLDVEPQFIRTTIQNYRDVLLRARTGAAVSPNEYERIQALLPNENTPVDTTFTNKLNRAVAELENIYRIRFGEGGTGEYFEGAPDIPALMPAVGGTPPSPESPNSDVEWIDVR